MKILNIFVATLLTSFAMQGWAQTPKPPEPPGKTVAKTDAKEEKKDKEEEKDKDEKKTKAHKKHTHKHKE